MPSNDLHYYLKRVERESGLEVSTTFPTTSINDQQQHTIDCINSTLRELNNHYFLAFKQTEYTLTTTAGTANYDLRQAPYSLTFFRVNRIARNGIIRTVDDFPLNYIDYMDRDFLQPNRTGNSLPTHWSQFGQEFLLYPAPNGGTLKIRYHAINIGTDSAGTTDKLRLSLTDDLPMLEDEYEDALVYGAATKVRRVIKTDEKYAGLKNIWEEWRTSLIDMMSAGEDAYPQMILPSSTVTYLDRKVGSFFRANIGD